MSPKKILGKVGSGQAGYHNLLFWKANVWQKFANR